MLSNFDRLPRDLMIKEHARVVERLDLASRLLNSQGEIITRLQVELKTSEKTNRELIETIRELNNLE